MNAEDAIAPWSAPRILRYLDGNPEHRMELLAVAGRLPEVAARTILCPLFSHRSLQQLAHSHALDTLSAMYKHAQTQQLRYEAEVRGDTCVFAKSDVISAAPAAEVTFAATVTSSLLEDTVLNLGKALFPLIDNSQGHLLSVLRKRIGGTHQDSSGVGVTEKSVLSTTPRRTLTLLPTKRTTKDVQKANGFSIKHNLPPSMSSNVNVARAVSSEDRCELLRMLGDTPLPFQVRSRDEVMLQQASQKTLEASMTVVLPEHVTPLPPWKRRRTTDLEDLTEREDIDDPLPPAPTAPPPIAHEHMKNATWVTEGELVLVNGRLVHREIKSSLEKTGKKADTIKTQNRTNSTTTTESTRDAKLKRPVPESGKRKSSKDVLRSSTSTPRMGTVGSQNVPLKSREELILLVGTLQISDVLREAFLIGLGGAVSKEEEENV